MPPKLQLDKAAWQWADITDPHNVTQEHVNMAYRLNLKPCSQGACKRNCRGNPFCLNALGEKSWFAKLDERKWHDFDPQTERRQKGSYVGLKNLGATCYVNTFLQLWFHNLPVRRALYQWRETHMPDVLSDDWTPSTICGHLQVIFALLQYSIRRYIDPSSFINHLGLDAGQQQDAQEFSKLFLSLLEDAMSAQAAHGSSNIVQQQFRGEYCYVTRCKNCGNESRTGSMFYELDLNIKGHKLLKECIEDFLKEEKLEGENQYMCESCESKQNATRAINLQSLPPVLNIQLLRFVFDKNTGHKKKINSFVQFPEVLDMSKYLRKPENTAVYDLTAVLIHRGPSAYSGHYVAHIRKGQQHPWYKFNDEDIEEMKGRNLHLGSEEEIQENSKEKKGRVAKGCHSSKNAYMLVYTRQGTQAEATPEECSSLEGLLPPGVQQYVLRDNDKFEEWITDLITARETKILSGKCEQEEVREKYLALFYEPGCDFEWLSIDWISKWLADPAKVPKVKNLQYLCQHQKLDPDVVPKLKCVRSQGAARVIEKHKPDVRLQGEQTLCWKCVRNRCHVTRMKQQMVNDEKAVNMVSKFTYDSELCYWVGRSSLRSWKKLALSTFHQDTQQATDKVVDEGGEEDGDEPEEKPGDMGGDKPGGEGQEKPSRDLGDNGEQDDDDQKCELQFNTDLLCDHSCLNPDKSCRRLIPEEIWQRLKTYFPTCPQYRRDDAVCEKCLRRQQRRSTPRVCTDRALLHRSQCWLTSLLGGTGPKLDVNQQVNVVSAVFLEEWRKFIKDNGRREPVTSIANTLLLCEHGGLLFPPTLNGHGELQDCVSLLWPSEWAMLIQHMGFDVEVTAVQLEETDGSRCLVTFPEICQDCLSHRLATEESNRFIFKDSVVYVRKIAQEKKNGVGPAPLEKVMPKGLGNGENSNLERAEDPDYLQSQAKKKKLDEESLTEKMMKMEEVGSLKRRSQRHRKTRGEKEVLVSSDLTLKDLKIKIMKQFSVPPFDQNLFLDGVNLIDDSSTLQDLKVSPGAVILLQADEPSEEAYPIEDIYRGSSKPERGFQGTNLLST
ncbi:LOW QUALITY PROTEIN: ubiquitin carboxyl-terminal hydrolase 48-like [Haliotis rubra]|uniref:LOW QUALITY PROTEIN: ubiquitin carboxyl-terminal hydrolase 48-like n=1 Tax=Haliotis rubra TaxID=36100 RepID=UPI001EE5312C|nr:LOW QUALITY PROTEIN: ubiquitin carboxyl-terminal hydrolase 48-like [Haliotis rubra]